MVSVDVSRAKPSDISWPSEAKWKAFGEQVGGRLFKVQTPLADCVEAMHSIPPDDAVKLLQNPYFIGDLAGATQSSGWVDGWVSTPSIYGVRAKCAADVSAAVSFAREHHLRVVVKGGGHSYQGTSCAADSLLIWTKGMDSIVLQDAFAMQGCEGTPQPAVTIGAGALWGRVYTEVTTKAKRYVQGGGCTTVGVAGLIQSGGFGSFSKRYGMAASWLLEAEVVTADGEIRVANACTNSELFWALKGGGGGSLGVVTRVTLATHELPAWFGRSCMTIKAASIEAFRRLVRVFFEFYRNSLFNSHWGESVTFGNNTLHITMVCQGLTEHQAQQVWLPFLKWVMSLADDLRFAGPPDIAVMPASWWWDKKRRDDAVSDSRVNASEDNWWFASTQGEVGAFWHGYGSVWLPDSLLVGESHERFLDALFAALQRSAVSLHFNKGLAGAAEDIVAASKDTATHPAVQTAFALAIVAGLRAPAYQWVPGIELDLARARRDAAAFAQAMQELHKVVPAPGAYLAESDFFEKNWQRAFWGDNYRRLQAVKAAYDPHGLFFVHHGVGSEDWSADGFTRISN